MLTHETTQTRGRPRGMSRSPSQIVTRSRAKLNEHAYRLMMRAVPRAGAENPAGADPAKLRTFIEHASLLYRGNPYHNWHHAVDVTHTAAWLATRPVFRRALAPSEVFWLLVSSLVHDLDHPGHNNAWEVAQRTDLAAAYGGKAVLEHHSLDMARALLDASECRFTDAMPERFGMNGLYLMEELILATDFAVHRQFIAKLEDTVDRYPAETGFDQPDFRLLILQALIKAADIGNVTKPYVPARMWAQRAMDEFRAQGRMEKAAGLPIAPINDESRTSLVQAQIGFIQFAALDLFGLLSRVEPEVRVLLRSLYENLTHYRVIAKSTGELAALAAAHSPGPAIGAQAIERHAG